MSLRNFSLVLSLPKLVDSHLLKEVAELGFALVEANAGWGAGADCTVGFTSEVDDDSVLLLLHSICVIIFRHFHSGQLFDFFQLRLIGLGFIFAC